MDSLGCLQVFLTLFLSGGGVFAVYWDFRGSKFWKVLNCEEESHADAGDIPAVGGDH